MGNQQGPTVRLRIIASQLRRLRAQSGKQQQEVAAAIDIAPTALSRYEGAVSSMQPAVAEKLFSYYGLTDDEMTPLIDHVKGSRKRGWLKGFTGIVPEWLEGLIALERDASKILVATSGVIPGILQTEGYARAVLSMGNVADKAEEHVRIRTRRAEILEKSQPPEYWCLLDEDTLRRQVGGAEVMGNQIQHLMKLAERPNVNILVLPFAQGAYLGMGLPFTLMRFDVAPHYGIVYVDYLTGSIYIDEPEEVEKYDSAFRHVMKIALSEDASMQRMESITKELKA